MATAVNPTAVPEEPVPSTSGAKRKAGSELTEPADKKSKTEHMTKEPDTFKSTQPGGIINLIANRFSSPFPIADTQFGLSTSPRVNGALVDVIVTWLL